ncbi:MAG: radical SAM protein [Rhodospirillaceae bacterium]|jgi:Fe-coproporphyrin III synthase|nr:radical SAM protein [Rhodospirillaceae bacterium]MBT4940741.1 radical SAM protein [Rhodospirillaceae bacterium]MBT5939978.1 radical SAM protein [Rhodospirillaceae bacterium]MBT7267125.1 radical SAM protein [Rhodospirillaceae bacterium]
MNIYDPYKFLGFPDNISAFHERRIVAPVHIRIKPINHCNHGCWYCAYRAGQLALGENMDLRDRIPDEKMVEIVDDVIEMGVKAITFSGGGEPLLYKSLPNHVRRLSENGVRVATLTNGSNLKNVVADAFANHGTWVRVSIDGWDDESYANNRGIKVGEFSKVVQNMRDFVDRKSQCTLGVSFIIDEKNCHHIFDACQLFKDIGVAHVKLSAAFVANELHDNTRYHQRTAQVATAQIETAQTLNSEKFRIVNHYHEMERRFDKPYQTCPFMQFLTVIGADCSVYTCQDKAYTNDGYLGSIADRRLSDVWYSDNLRDRIFGLNPQKTCNHHCVAHQKNIILHEMQSVDQAHQPFV